MKALVWHATNDVRVERVPDPDDPEPARRHHQDHDDRDLRLRPAPLDGYIPTMQAGDILGHEFMGEVVEVGRDNTQAQGRRPRRRTVHHRVRPLLLLRTAAVVALRQLEPERVDGREAVRLHDVGTVRLLAPDRRLRRRAGGVRARAVRRRRTAEGSRTGSPTSRCCSSPIFFRPATWRRRTATSSGATPSRSGAAGPSGSWPSAARSCSAPSASSRSTRCPERLRMAHGGRSRSHQLRATRTSSSASRR